MSVQYENEIEPSEASYEQTENVQRIEYAFPLYSVILIVCLVAVSLVQFYIDGSDGAAFGGEKSIFLAGLVKPLFWEGQSWRVLTGAALHGGIIHLAFNCYALYILGKLVEMLSNRAHLAIVFLLSAIGGGLLSLVFMPESISVGASGGIIGFLGYLTVYGFKRRKILTNSFLKSMLMNIAFITLFGIVLNQSENLPRIDNYGHLGGLLTGALYGAFQISGDIYKDPRPVGSFTKFAGIAALGFFIAVCVFTALILLGVVPVAIPDLYLLDQI